MVFLNSKSFNFSKAIFFISIKVNDHISKEFYLGEKVELSYPNVDDLVGIIKDKGPRCMLFKKDFSL
jgi:hypothetical protein